MHIKNVILGTYDWFIIRIVQSTRNRYVKAAFTLLIQNKLFQKAEVLANNVILVTFKWLIIKIDPSIKWVLSRNPLAQFHTYHSQ